MDAPSPTSASSAKAKRIALISEFSVLFSELQEAPYVARAVVVHEIRKYSHSGRTDSDLASSQVHRLMDMTTEQLEDVLETTRLVHAIPSNRLSLPIPAVEQGEDEDEVSESDESDLDDYVAFPATSSLERVDSLCGVEVKDPRRLDESRFCTAMATFKGKCGRNTCRQHRHRENRDLPLLENTLEDWAKLRKRDMNPPSYVFVSDTTKVIGRFRTATEFEKKDRPSQIIHAHRLQEAREENL